MFLIKHWRLRIKQWNKIVRSVIDRFFFYSLILFIVTGCVPISIALPTASPAISSKPPINSQSATLPVISTSLPVDKELLKFYSPKIEKRCPENREVTFNKLGISNELKIILSDMTQTGLWTSSIADSNPILLQAVPLDRWVSYSINSTGEYLAFTVGNADGSSSVWLLSLISKEQNEISKLENMDGAFPYIKWLSKDELLVGVSCGGAGCPFPVKVINIVTGDEVDVSEDKSGVADYYISFLLNNNGYLVLYSTYVDDGYIRFYAYDYSAEQKIAIFPWLDEKVFFYPLVGTNFGLMGSDDYLTMYIEQSYGYDAGIVGTSIDEMAQDLSYDSIMKRVFTQIAFGDIDYSFVVANPVRKDLLMSMSYVDNVNTDFNEDFAAVPKYIDDALFAVDLDNPIKDERIDHMPYIDYCFVTTGLYSRGFSPDGRIMVFSSDDEIVFLNLETGDLSRLSNWSFVGWAR